MPGRCAVNVIVRVACTGTRTPSIVRCAVDGVKPRWIRPVTPRATISSGRLGSLDGATASTHALAPLLVQQLEPCAIRWPGSPNSMYAGGGTTVPTAGDEPAGTVLLPDVPMPSPQPARAISPTRMHASFMPV